MFIERELLILKQSLDSLRVDLVKLYSASKEVGMSVERIKNELEEVEALHIKVDAILKHEKKNHHAEASEVWRLAEDLCLNPGLK